MISWNSVIASRTMLRMRLLSFILAIAGLAVSANADPLLVRTGGTTYTVDPATLEIAARPDGETSLPVMPALHAAEAAKPQAYGSGWLWTDSEGRIVTVGTQSQALHVTISAPAGAKLDWPLPKASGGIWLVPDGEGMAYKADDAFWRKAYGEGDCLGGTTTLSFPAWSYMTDRHAVTYALGDGLLSELCLHDDNGLQARLTHDFEDGAGTIELNFAVRPAEPLAPALFYRQLIKARGQFKAFKDKGVPGLPRLFGAPQVYVWGDGRDLALLEALKTLGIRRLTISYDQDPMTQTHLVRPEYLRRAKAMGYLAGPYESFDNAQPAATADTPVAIWGDLYPAGCIRNAQGGIKHGFANRGCEMSSEAVARHPGPPSPSSRYTGHVKDGASQLFIDVDAFGEFYNDFSPDHPMSMAKDRQNRLARLGMAIDRYKLVLGSENVTAWSSVVTHYSHGTAEAHVSPLWGLQRDRARFGGYWPPERPPLFFKPIALTPDEDRLLLAPADRLPLFEAAFHDSVVAADRWEFGLMKVTGEERHRFARSLLYGTPTMWNLDQKELKRVGAWLKAAEDDFEAAHGWEAPVALTGFAWRTADHLVQQTTWADGRIIVANFGSKTWQGLGPDCVGVSSPGQKPFKLCPPKSPAPFEP